MSEPSARQRLDTPRTSRRLRPNFDPDAVGRFSESIARFLGTGRYLFWQTVIVVVWIGLNVGAVSLRWDPYPFILLNLAFSTQAAYAAPLILLAQNRQENRDRVSLDEDRRRAGWRSAKSPPATICAANSTNCAPSSKIRGLRRTPSRRRRQTSPNNGQSAPPSCRPDVLVKIQGGPMCIQSVAE